MSNDKWLMFKNYMHNELGISKEDVRQWLKEAVEEEAERLVAQEYGKFDIGKAIERSIYENRLFWTSEKTLAKEIRQELCSKILERYTFLIRTNENEGLKI